MAINPNISGGRSNDDSYKISDAVRKCIPVMRAFFASVGDRENAYHPVFSDGEVSDGVVTKCLEAADHAEDKVGAELGHMMLALSLAERTSLIGLDKVEVFDVPGSLLSALTAILQEWKVTMGTRSSPFENNASTFACPVFELRAYSWVSVTPQYCFKWNDIEVSWYKYFGRGMSVNRPVSSEESARLAHECTAALKRCADGSMAFD